MQTIGLILADLICGTFFFEALIIYVKNNIIIKLE